MDEFPDSRAETNIIVNRGEIHGFTLEINSSRQAEKDPEPSTAVTPAVVPNQLGLLAKGKDIRQVPEHRPQLSAERTCPSSKDPIAFFPSLLSVDRARVRFSSLDRALILCVPAALPRESPSELAACYWSLP